MPLDKLLEDLDSLSLLHIKKLQAKRRQLLQSYDLTNYQQIIAEQTVRIKNALFLRQMRSCDVLQDFQQIEQSIITTNVYYNYNDIQYVLIERQDNYAYYQPEYMLSILPNSNIFTSFDFSFYGPTKSFFLLEPTVPVHDFINYIQKIVDGLVIYKNAISHVLYLSHQLLKILNIIHKAGISLSGDFGSFVIKNDVLKLNLAAFQIKLPEDLNQGIQKDYAAFKELLVNCLPVFIKTRDQTLSDSLNDVFNVLNSVINSNFADNSLFIYSQANLPDITQKLLYFPFFDHPLYPHFLSRDITAAVIYNTIINPLILPEILKLEQIERTEAENLENSVANIDEIRSIQRAKSAHNAIKYYGKMQAAFGYQMTQKQPPTSKFQQFLQIEKYRERKEWDRQNQTQNGSINYKNCENYGFQKINMVPEDGERNENQEWKGAKANVLKQRSKSIEQTFIAGPDSEMLMNAFSIETGFIGQKTKLFQCTHYNARDAKITANLRSASVRKIVQIQDQKEAENLFKVVPLFQENGKVVNQVKQIQYLVEEDHIADRNDSKQEIKDLVKGLMNI
ncbi:hypothetical protein SS50377_24341 [Spironucleus salmonicida]|uniref:Uncharacterized protein n=1 Tax=Spironucleus salmonicida TaxID=348837 RepID=V6LN35_9EUKA|nr:hypothetical protein SS50377_24341 [Spironucleus salmonicida]|eukprot:EST46107.1 hypothetical protein SS50377_14101 [Spironucleus salmonicida]